MTLPVLVVETLDKVGWNRYRCLRLLLPCTGPVLICGLRSYRHSNSLGRRSWGEFGLLPIPSSHVYIESMGMRIL